MAQERGCDTLFPICCKSFNSVIISLSSALFSEDRTFVGGWEHLGSAAPGQKEHTHPCTLKKTFLSTRDLCF
jgi:hypothetical protein